MNLYHLRPHRLFYSLQSENTRLNHQCLRCTSVSTWKRQQRGRDRVSFTLWYSNVFLGDPLNSTQPLSFTSHLQKKKKASVAASHQLAVWYWKSVRQKLSGSEHVECGNTLKKKEKKVVVDFCISVPQGETQMDGAEAEGQMKTTWWIFMWSSVFWLFPHHLNDYQPGKVRLLHINHQRK